MPVSAPRAAHQCGARLRTPLIDCAACTVLVCPQQSKSRPLDGISSHVRPICQLAPDKFKAAGTGLSTWICRRQTYPVAVAGAAIDDLLSGLTPSSRAVVQRVVVVVQADAPFDAAIKWRQLSFDHWICAVSATKQRVSLAFHLGSVLRDNTGAFAASDAKYVRKVGDASADDVDEAVVHNRLAQAVEAIRRRGPAGPVRRRR